MDDDKLYGLFESVILAVRAEDWFRDSILHIARKVLDVELKTESGAGSAGGSAGAAAAAGRNSIEDYFVPDFLLGLFRILD